MEIDVWIASDRMTENTDGNPSGILYSICPTFISTYTSARLITSQKYSHADLLHFSYLLITFLNSLTHLNEITDLLYTILLYNKHPITQELMVFGSMFIKTFSLS